MQRYRPVKLLEGRGSRICTAILDFSSLVPASGSCSLQSPFWVTVKSCFEFSSGAGWSLAAGSPDSLCLCSVTSLVPCLGISSCWGLPWSMEISIYYQHLSTDSIIGQSFITKLDLVWLDWEVARSRWERPACSGQGVTAPLLQLGGGYW